MKTAVEQLIIDLDLVKFSVRKEWVKKREEAINKAKLTESVRNKTYIDLIKVLVIIADRYEKERQGLYDDELVILNDAKFQLRLNEKERGQNNN